MANRKISDLTALTTPVTGDLLPIVDISEAAAVDQNKKITFGELFASIPAGTAAAPSVAFEGDNTGIYSPGADQLAISTNGLERGRVDSSGRHLVGTSSARSNVYYTTVATTPSVQFETSGSFYNGLSLINYSASGFSPVLTLGLSASNTPGTNTAIASTHELGAINFTGNDGTNFRTGASIVATNDQASAWAVGDCPTRLVFFTTADGAASPTERMRISSNGSIRTGNTITYTGTTGAVTATTGTIVFSFDFSGATTRHTAMIRLSVMHFAATNDINKQAAAEYLLATEAYSTGVVAATSPTAVFQNQYVAATHFAFASTGATTFTITLTEPIGTAASAVYYKVEILDNGSACLLSSVATT
jgi:hypothetical protein